MTVDPSPDDGEISSVIHAPCRFEELDGVVCSCLGSVYLSLSGLNPGAVCDSGGLQSRVEGAAELCQGLPAG